MIAEVIFWVCVLAIFHSYVLFPLLLEWVAKNKKPHDNTYDRNDNLPSVAVFMSVYNEEKVMREKLDSLVSSDYPRDRFSIHIGSDGSTDATDDIIRQYQLEYSNVYLTRFSGRNGKSNILNRLVNELDAQAEVFMFTDANVIFQPQTIFELAKHFKDEDIGLVGANILNKSYEKGKGISYQEKEYIQRENRIKYLEGHCWGTMMGAFGACYAMRSDLFSAIPPNFLMEDYYITMNVLEKGKKSISELSAVCYEDVSDDIHEEFKRKVRISAGNFQNLGRFWKLLWPPFTGLSFSFFSHKVLRWLGPLFMIGAYFASAYLAQWNEFYKLMFIVQSILLVVPLIDYIFNKAGLHSVILRFISYFNYMNLALLIGFIKYIKGVKTNVWQPTKRNRP